MERIEYFDQYLSGKLSATEEAAFKQQLESDEDFAAEFKTYLISVRGICQEAEQENIEFAHAMKQMTKEQLRSIIGKTEKQTEKQRTVARPSFWRERMMWIASIAAMLVVVVGIGWNLYSASQNHLCDVVFDLTYKPLPDSRGDGSKAVDLNILTKEQIENLIPEIRAAFEADKVDSQDWHIDGMNLAMAYLKLHRKNEALKVLGYLSANSTDSREYKLILEQFK